MAANKKIFLFAAIFILGLGISAISPHDYFTWILEVFPGIIGLILILATRNTFPLSNFLLGWILIHCYVLFIGGHYTYAEVPFFNYLKEVLHQSRNNYDKIGHFMQGFVPALVAREILIRKNVLSKKSWLPFICVSICLAISACYELLEMGVAVLTEDSAEAFLGTQGYMWDTQSDMLYALIGALIALIFFSKWQDRSIAMIR